MGQAAEPTQEELEFLFPLLNRLNDREVQDEMQENTGFPVRRDPRYYRKWRRAWAAAKKVLEDQGKAAQDPLLLERRRDHEALLVEGLKALNRGSLDAYLPRGWSWATGEPRRGNVEESGLQLELPDTSPVRCLLKHLEREDPILAGHRDSGKRLRKYLRLCGDFYGELIKQAQALNMPLVSKQTAPAPALTPGFVDSLLETGGHLVLGYDEIEEVKYQKVPPDGGTPFPQLWAGNHRVALGEEAQLDKTEIAHRQIRVALKGNPLIRDIRTAMEAYEEAVREQNHRVEVKAQQRAFLPGPCEICEPWEGLQSFKTRPTSVG